MDTKHLIKKHQKLLKNSNFLNSQNYVLGNFLEAKISKRYEKNNTKIIFISLYKQLLLILTPIMFVGIFEKRGLYLSVTLLIGLIPLLLYVVYIILNYSFFYKKYYINGDKFIGRRHIFRKKIRSNIYKNDYIIFNKKDSD